MRPTPAARKTNPACQEKGPSLYRDFASSTDLYCRLLLEVKDRLEGDGMALAMRGRHLISCFVGWEIEVNVRRVDVDAHCLQRPSWAARIELKSGDAISDVSWSSLVLMIGWSW